MHFFYIDETGCNGRDLTQTEQPIFVSGGIILRDEGWNKTHAGFERLINNYFEGEVPEGFEFHTQDLFSTNGSGHFLGHTRERRNQLINEILDLVIDRKHQFAYCGIDKSKLNESNVDLVRDREYLELKTPYLVAYDYLLNIYEKYTRVRLGQSARALVIIDEKDSLIEEIENITVYKRFECSKTKRIKLIVEFTYPVSSKKNTMIQISDLLLFLTRKFLEIENGYKDTYPSAVKNIFRSFYRKVNSRLIYRTIQQEEGRNSEYYNNFINEIMVFPTRRWNSRVYN